MKNVLKPLGKGVLIPLGLTAPDAGIHIYFGIITAKNISNFK